MNVDRGGPAKHHLDAAGTPVDAHEGETVVCQCGWRYLVEHVPPCSVACSCGRTLELGEGPVFESVFVYDVF